MLFDTLLIGVNGSVVVYMLYTVCVPVLARKARAMKEKRKAKNVQVAPKNVGVEEKEKQVLKLMTFSKKQTTSLTIGESPTSPT